MRHAKPSQRIALAALVALAFVTLGLSIPVFVETPTRSLVIQAATVQAASTDSYSVTQPVRLLSSPNVVLRRGTVSIPSERGRPPPTGEVIAALLAAGNAKLALEDATIAVELERGTAIDDAEIAAPLAPLMKALSRLGFSTLSIRRSVVLLQRASGTTEALSDVRLDITHKRGSALAAVGSFELQGRQMTVDATLGLTSDRKDMLRLPLKASVKGALIEASVSDGRLVLGDNLHLVAENAEIQAGGLRRLASWLGSPWPGERGLGNFHAQGQLEWRDRTITFHNAAFRLDGNEATGTLTFGWAKDLPAIEGTLALKEFDLKSYLGTQTEKPEGASIGQTLLGWLRATIDPGGLALPLVRYLDADLRISADEVTTPRGSFGRSAASISVKDAQLLADVAELDLGSDGNLRGQLSVDMRGYIPRYVMRGKLDAVDAGKVTAQFFDQAVMSGRSMLTFDLAGNGSSIDELADTLHGKLGFSLPEGGSAGLDAIQLAATLAQAGELEGWAPPGSARGQSRLTQFASRFSVDAGVLTVESVKMATSERAISLFGNINLASRTLDARMTLSAIKPAASEAGDATAAERTPAAAPVTPTEVITLRGPWNEPTLRYSILPSKEAAPTPSLRHPG